MPSLQWGGYEAFLGDSCGAKPPFLEDYGIAIIDDAVDETECFGRVAVSLCSICSPGVMTPLLMLLGVLKSIW